MAQRPSLNTPQVVTQTKENQQEEDYTAAKKV